MELGNTRILSHINDVLYLGYLRDNSSVPAYSAQGVLDQTELSTGNTATRDKRPR